MHCSMRAFSRCALGGMTAGVCAQYVCASGRDCVCLYTVYICKGVHSHMYVHSVCVCIGVCSCACKGACLHVNVHGGMMNSVSVQGGVITCVYAQYMRAGGRDHVYLHKMCVQGGMVTCIHA